MWSAQRVFLKTQEPILFKPRNPEQLLFMLLHLFPLIVPDLEGTCYEKAPQVIQLFLTDFFPEI
jgi:hypothetical protein